MTKLWYQDLSVLTSDIYQFFPSNNLSENERINAIARLAIYYAAIIILTGKNQNYLTVSVVLLLVSYMLGKSENFETFESKEKNKKCVRPTVENPFMNFTIADYYKDPARPKNCPIDDVRKEMREKFHSRLIPDFNDLWGQNISDRNFYTMPVTTIVNDSVGFGNWLYGSMGQCKANGKNCLKRALSRTSTGMFGSVI